MSVESFAPAPLGTFGGLITLLDPSDVPPGMSLNLGDVEFFAGGVRTRAGLVSQFTPLAGGVGVNGLKTYITANLVQRLLAFDSSGNLYKETSPGVLGLVASPGTPNLFLDSTTLFGREYMAFSDSLVGQDLPRQFDDTYFDRVSQCGPGAGPAAADATAAGNISAGVHQVVVIFVTRQGFWTAPSPAISWTAAGGKQVTLTNIPIGPSNVVARFLAFTGAGGADFYQVPATMTINDNTTTSLTLDFDDTILLSGTAMDNQFGQIELPNQLGVIDYSDRLFWWGERAKMSNWNNITFDGGWNLAGGTGGSDVPLGWASDPTSGVGGSGESSDVVWGDAYRITGNASSVARGMISQSAVTDPSGNPLLVKNTDYSVRARVKRSANLAQGTLRINCFSPTAGAIGVGLAITALTATTFYIEYTAQLIPPQSTIPSDMVLRAYADGVPGPSGESFLVDQLEIFPTLAPQNASIVRSSRALNAESYDGVTGLLEVAENNGQGIRAAFTLRDYLYIVKERSLFVTQDDGVNEPALWDIEEVSNQVGTPSAHGVGIGEEWVVMAGRAGLYYFDGGNPVKLSQEIQPTWDAINWEYGSQIWVEVDIQQKRILVGVPMGAATAPSQILVLDYTEGFLDPLQTMLSQPGYGRQWTQWFIAANSSGLIERASGVAQLFFGNNAANGKIYSLTPGAYSDDGAAINSYYTTAFLSRTGLGGRNLFGYATGNVQGSGTLALAAILPGNVTNGLGSWPLASPATQDMEIFTSILAERVAYQVSTGAAGAWFSLTKLVPWAKPDPWSIVRGQQLGLARAGQGNCSSNYFAISSGQPKILVATPTCGVRRGSINCFAHSCGVPVCPTAVAFFAVGVSGGWMQRVIGSLALVGLFLALTGCGGSSFPLALAISTSPGTISGGGTYTFSATTTNSTSQAGVIWSLALNTPSSTTDTTTPCSSPCGTWVNAGTTVTSQTTSGSTTYYNTVTSITYTAPLTPPTPNSIVLTAAAPSNAAVTADVIFEVGTPAIVVRLANTFTTIAPGAAPVTLNATVQYDSANAGVNWTLAAGGSPCSPACGTLSPAAAPSFSAVYTPPTILPTAPNNSPTITATSVASSTSTAFDSFVIQTPPLPVSVQITNPFATVAAGSPGVTVNAQVTNDQQGQGVTWSISPSSNTGSLSANEPLSVLYTPPNAAPQPPYNTPTITATSVADPTKSASFTFTIDSSSAAKSACDTNGSYVFRLSGTDSFGKPIVMVGNMTLETGKVMVNSVDVNDDLEVRPDIEITGMCRTVAIDKTHTEGRIAFDSAFPSFGEMPNWYLHYPETQMVYGGSDKRNFSLDIYSQEVATLPEFGGDFAFYLRDQATATETASIGRFTLSFDGAKGTITKGLIDASARGVGALATAESLTGTATPPDANGRGTINLNFAGRGSRAFVYYAASASEFVLAEMDPSANLASAAKETTFGPSLASGNASGQTLGSPSPGMMETIGILQGRLLTFDATSGRGTLAMKDSNIGPLVIYVALPAKGWFLDKSGRSSNTALANSFRIPVADPLSPGH